MVVFCGKPASQMMSWGKDWWWYSWWNVQDELPDSEHTVPPTPHKTLGVFAIFEAKDTTTTLHVGFRMT
jgi:hypothetical protein